VTPYLHEKPLNNRGRIFLGEPCSSLCVHTVSTPALLPRDNPITFEAGREPAWHR